MQWGWRGGQWPVPQALHRAEHKGDHMSGVAEGGPVTSVIPTSLTAPPLTFKSPVWVWMMCYKSVEDLGVYPEGRRWEPTPSGTCFRKKSADGGTRRPSWRWGRLSLGCGKQGGERDGSEPVQEVTELLEAGRGRAPRAPGLCAWTGHGCSPGRALGEDVWGGRAWVPLCGRSGSRSTRPLPPGSPGPS